MEADKRPGLCIQAYRRIVRNEKRGMGVHLSAEEVWALATYDAAVFMAVSQAELEDEIAADTRQEE